MSRQEISLFILIITEYKILAEYIKDNLDIMIEHEKGRINGILWSMFALNIINSSEKTELSRFINSL